MTGGCTEWRPGHLARENCTAPRATVGPAKPFGSLPVMGPEGPGRPSGVAVGGAGAVGGLVEAVGRAFLVTAL